jgi:hypothetical protein
MICSLSMALRDDSWLSLTPEPERLLPEARAVLRSGQAPPPRALLEAERAATERLVLRARRRSWEAWLRESAALAQRGLEPNGEGAGIAERGVRPGVAPETLAAAAALVREVVANHDALVLGLPGERRNRRR